MQATSRLSGVRLKKQQRAKHDMAFPPARGANPLDTSARTRISATATPAGTRGTPMTTQLVRDIMKAVIASGFDPTEVQWFDVSKAYSGQNPVKSQYLATHRPPFEKNLVVYGGASKSHPYYEVMMLVAGTDPEEGIVVDISKGTPGNYKTFPPLVYVVDDGQIRYGPADENHEVPHDVAELMLSLVAMWFESMDAGCDSYKAEVAQTFTNKRKIAQGKLPTYDWKTVVVITTPPKAKSKGGTHASPRLHDRRGHLRRLRSGKNVWVKPHKVGDAKLGTVFHDYQIGA
jgi:hypothetical protein